MSYHDGDGILLGNWDPGGLALPVLPERDKNKKPFHTIGVGAARSVALNSREDVGVRGYL